MLGWHGWIVCFYPPIFCRVSIYSLKINVCGVEPPEKNIYIYIRKAFFLFFEVYKSVGINQMERDLLNKFKPSQFYIIHNKSCNDNLNVTEGTEHQICANRLVVCEPPHINTWERQKSYISIVLSTFFHCLNCEWSSLMTVW